MNPWWCLIFLCQKFTKILSRVLVYCKILPVRNSLNGWENDRGKIDCIEAKLDGVDCRVCFFKSWGSYGHPVVLDGPLYFEQAIARERYYRAWISTGSKLGSFLLLEGVANQRLETTIEKPRLSSGELITVYRVRRFGDEIAIGEKLDFSAAIHESEYLVGLPDASPRLILVQQQVGRIFGYHYKADGSLDTVTVARSNSEVSVLQYSRPS